MLRFVLLTTLTTTPLHSYSFSVSHARGRKENITFFRKEKSFIGHFFSSSHSHMFRLVYDEVLLGKKQFFTVCLVLDGGDQQVYWIVSFSRKRSQKNNVLWISNDDDDDDDEGYITYMSTLSQPFFFHILRQVKTISFDMIITGTCLDIYMHDI